MVSVLERISKLAMTSHSWVLHPLDFAVALHVVEHFVDYFPVLDAEEVHFSGRADLMRDSQQQRAVAWLGFWEKNWPDGSLVFFARQLYEVLPNDGTTMVRDQMKIKGKLSNYGMEEWNI